MPRCPRCKTQSDLIHYEGVPVYNCGTCGGYWLTAAKLDVILARRGVIMDISASTLFGTGEAVLQESSLEVLRQVAAVLSKEDMPIEVEGHTDDTPIETTQYPSNWELSSARASSVVRILIDNGVPAKRLAVVGLASNQPLAPNNSAENRARNRRVTITIASPNLDREAGG